MAYEFACADAGVSDCDFMIRDENREELMEFVREHARDVHGKEMSESDVQDTMRQV